MSLTYDTLNSVTREYLEKVCVDNITTATPTLERLFKGKKQISGTKIQFPIVYALNSQGGSYARAGQLGTTNDEFETKGELTWAFYDKPMRLYGTDLAQNSAGETQIRDLLKDTIDNQALALVGDLSDDIFSTKGTTNNIYGLYDAIGTTTYAGIDPGDASCWVAGVNSTTTTLTPTVLYNAIASATYGLDGSPDFGVTTLDLFTQYLGKVLDPKVRYMYYERSDNWLSKEMEIVKLGAIDFTWDRDVPSGDLLLIDTKKTQFYTLPMPDIAEMRVMPLKYGFSMIKWFVPADYDYAVSHLRVYLQLVCKSRRTNYLFTALTSASAT